MKVEKKSKYFLNLQKGHLKNGVVSPLQLGDKEISSLEKEILSQCETFYRNIYSSETDFDDSRINDLFSGNTASKSLDLEDKMRGHVHQSRMLTRSENYKTLFAHRIL